MLDALPAGLPLSIEWGRSRDSDVTATEWASIALNATSRFIERYEQAKQA